MLKSTYVQRGTLQENTSSLRQTHLPQVFDQHMQKVLQEIREKKNFVVFDETSDNRDRSVLNIVIGEHPNCFAEYINSLNKKAELWVCVTELLKFNTA